MEGSYPVPPPLARRRGVLYLLAGRFREAVLLHLWLHTIVQRVVTWSPLASKEAEKCDHFLEWAGTLLKSRFIIMEEEKSGHRGTTSNRCHIYLTYSKKNWTTTDPTRDRRTSGAVWKPRAALVTTSRHTLWSCRTCLTHQTKPQFCVSRSLQLFSICPEGLKLAGESPTTKLSALTLKPMLYYIF